MMALLLFVFLGYFGERLVLIISKGRYVVDDEILINQVKNFCCHLEVPEVKVYWSNSFSQNIYYAKTYKGTPVLIIGRDLYRDLSRNELNAMIYASLLRIKSKSTEHRTVLNLIFFVMYSPLFFLRAIIKNEFAFNFLNMFLYSALVVQASAFPNMQDVLKFDFVATGLSGLKHDYFSALVKINLREERFEYSAGAMILFDLCHVRNKSQDVIFDLLIDKMDVSKRIRELSLTK